MSTKILMIASGDQLNTSAEISHILSTNEVMVISDQQATIENILSRTRGRRFDAVHITSHFDGEKFILANDVFLWPAQVVQIAKRARARIAYLNACGTVLVAQYLIDNEVPAVISNSRQVIRLPGDGALDIHDTTAIANAAMYYDELAANGGDHRMAFERTKTDDGALSWHSNGNYIAKAVEPLVKRMDRMEAGAQLRCRILIAVGALIALMAVGEALIAWRLLAQ